MMIFADCIFPWKAIRKNRRNNSRSEPQIYGGVSAAQSQAEKFPGARLRLKVEAAEPEGK
jgi:hypothetical protein